MFFSLILPTITGLALPFQSIFYLHVGLLHLSLSLRIAGDVAQLLWLQRWGGLLNAAAILLFLANNVRAVRSGDAGALHPKTLILRSDDSPKQESQID